VYADIDGVFGEWSFAIRGVVDRGDRLAVRADFVAHGRSSGVETTLKDVGMLVEYSPRGKIARQDWFVESGGWRRAFEAAGLSE